MELRCAKGADRPSTRSPMDPGRRRDDGAEESVADCEVGWWWVEVSRFGGHPLRSLRSASPSLRERDNLLLAAQGRIETCLYVSRKGRTGQIPAPTPFTLTLALSRRGRGGLLLVDEGFVGACRGCLG